MKPAAFDYAAAQSLPECLDLLARHGDDARLLAGGQSLVPSLALRLSAPALLVDINVVPELGGAPRLEGGVLRLPALTRHVQLTRDPLVAAQVPLLREAASWIAHAAIRNRGTLGGSLALGDPASELPACAVLLDATILLRSRDGGSRRVRAEGFYRGLFDTDRAAEELIEAVEFPTAPGRAWAFREVARRRGDYATVGVAATAERRGGRLVAPRIVLFGVADRPVLARAAAEAVAAAPMREVAAAGARAALPRDVAPVADVWHSAEAKALIAAALIEEVVRDLWG